MTSGKPLILRLGLVSLAICLLTLLPSGLALASDHEEPGDQMDMGSDAGSDSDAGTGDMQMGTTNSDSAAATGDMQMGTTSSGSAAGTGDMQMGTSDSWQDKINRVSYPTTAVVALLAVWVCVLLMRATGMVDKFGLISIGLGLFVVQAIFGVVFYLSDGDLVTMPTLMFVMSLATSLALLLIGGAFYRWQRMIK